MRVCVCACVRACDAFTSVRACVVMPCAAMAWMADMVDGANGADQVLPPTFEPADRAPRARPAVELDGGGQGQLLQLRRPAPLPRPRVWVGARARRLVCDRSRATCASLTCTLTQSQIHAHIGMIVNGRGDSKRLRQNGTRPFWTIPPTHTRTWRALVGWCSLVGLTPAAYARLCTCSSGTTGRRPQALAKTLGLTQTRLPTGCFTCFDAWQRTRRCSSPSRRVCTPCKSSSRCHTHALPLPCLLYTSPSPRDRG